MNIFILSLDPVEAAQYQCDKHVVKMVLETAQLLSTTHRLLGSTDEILYKVTHKNHPCAIWARQSTGNYDWLIEHFVALSDEYKYRYNKEHLSWTKLGYIFGDYPKDLPVGPQTPFALAMGTHPECIGPDPVESYRKYYKTKQENFNMVWTKRPIPEWFNA